MKNFDAVFEFENNSYNCILTSRLFEENENLPKQFKTVFKDVDMEGDLMKLVSDFHQDIAFGEKSIGKEVKITFNGNTWLIDDIKLRGINFSSLDFNNPKSFNLETGWKCENYKKGGV